MLNQRELVALADIIGSIRPDWQQPGIIAALRQIPGDLATITAYAVTNANDPAVLKPTAALLGRTPTTGTTTTDTDHQARLTRARAAAQRKRDHPERHRTRLAPDGWYDTHPHTPDRPRPWRPLPANATAPCDTCDRTPQQCEAVRRKLGNDHDYTPRFDTHPDNLEIGEAIARPAVPHVNHTIQLPWLPDDLTTGAQAEVASEPEGQP